MTAADWNTVLPGLSGLISTAGLVAVHIIRELRKPVSELPRQTLPPLQPRPAVPAAGGNPNPQPTKGSTP